MTDTDSERSRLQSRFVRWVTLLVITGASAARSARQPCGPAPLPDTVPAQPGSG
jgi:hypothetical protein